MIPFFTAPENRSRLIVLWIVVASVVIGGGTAIGLHLYRPWRQERLMSEARAAAERGDFAVASLNLRRALQTSPNDVRVCRLMAEILEEAQSPDAVWWQGRIAELSPGSTDAAMEWARVALKFRKYSTTEKALAVVPEADRQRIDWLTTAGSVAFESGRNAEAEKHFAAALAQQPDEPGHRLALGRVQVLSSDFFTRETGRAQLRQLAAQPEHALTALRALAASHEASGEPVAALRDIERILQTPGYTFLDELTRLRLLHRTEDERFAATLADLQSRAATVPKNAGALIVWMGSVELAREAIAWATEREPKVGRMPEVRQAVAGCYLALKDWEAALKITATGPWPQGDYIRHAYRSRALRGRGERQLARTEWNLATSAAQERPEAIQWLSRIAAGADWTDEREQALWMAVANVPDPKWAVSQLGRRFHEKRDTANLHRLATRSLAADPQNDNLRNDLAFLSVLIGKEPERALIDAQSLHRKHPDNAAYASTYALALHVARRSEEALEVFEKIPAETRAQPAFAAHFGVILAANGRWDDAAKYLDLGRLAPLLPEEAALLEKAARMVADSNR
jgi:tetratricopeptide (TPR) repeat protein